MTAKQFLCGSVAATFLVLFAARDVMFGKAFDRPFKQAFVEPKWFNRYTRTFEGMLDPGVTVPFGDGWKEVVFDAVKDTAYVRVSITKYWGVGGGLNEVQVYGKQAYGKRTRRPSMSTLTPRPELL